MLIKGIRRLVFVVGPVLLVALVLFLIYGSGHVRLPFHAGTGWATPGFAGSPDSAQPRSSLQDKLSLGGFGLSDIFDSHDDKQKDKTKTAGHDHGNSNSNSNENEDLEGPDMSETHVEVFSPSTPNGQYFAIEFGDEEAINPSILPHPELADTWIMVAQQGKSADPESVWFTELVCEAVFSKKKDRLACVRPPKILPIAATVGDKCVDNLAFFALNVGPHDARVFYGPSAPYAVYGSNSAFTCFGQWIQDFRVLVEWKGDTGNAVNGASNSNSNNNHNHNHNNHNDNTDFRLATELQRPGTYGPVEKNWFIFWDAQGDAYVHYDISPRRAFAKLVTSKPGSDPSVSSSSTVHSPGSGSGSGSVGPDLAPLAALAGDDTCLARHMPHVADQLESIHQATNSLSITLCARADLACKPSDSNTFILTVFQHKSFYMYHSVYEPYVMLFRRTAPFDVHAIGAKPIWIHGRGRPGEAPRPDAPEFDDLDDWNQSEMFYVTSVSWKSAAQRYHGYIDDVLFLNFGIEDKRTGGIDVVAGDLLRDLNLCASL